MQLLRPRSNFGRNVLTLASGTAVAQVIPVLASPILTRLYYPNAFGILALYVPVVSVGAVLVTGRYELAILIPRDDAEARDLLVLALALSVGLSTILALLLLASSPLAAAGFVPRVPSWAWIAPLGILLTAATQSLGYWINRQSRYRQLVTSRVLQSGSMFGVQTLGGALTARAGVLVAGHVAGQLTAVVSLSRAAWRADGGLLRATSLEGLRRVASLHRRFPLFMVPGHLANAASLQIPTVLLAAFFGPAIAGLYSLAERVLVLPSSLVGSAIGDVYRQAAAEAYNRTGNCRELYLQTLRRLALISILPCAIVIVGGPWLFSFAFGTAWRESGALASVLAAMVFFQMISSPLSQTVLLANMQRVDMAWQMARLGVAAASIYTGYALFDDHVAAVALYAGGFAVLHMIHSLLQYRAACGVAPSPLPVRE